MVDALPLRIFIASPSELQQERQAIRDCIKAHNARENTSSDSVTYEAVEWDQVRGTAMRAQDAINQLIFECHFMIVLFKREWGNTPGSPWGYTSGTEEEFFTALIDLGQLDRPMRDVWLAFLDDPNRDTRIDDLREHIVQRHSVMFEDITDESELREKFSERLESWETSARSKQPRHIELTPSSGRDVLRAANRRIQGEKLIELGQPEAGRAALKEAAELGGPAELLAYATCQRRSGDLVGAAVSAQAALDFFIKYNQLYTSAAADAFAALARVRSAQRRYTEAAAQLEHALTLLTGTDDHTRAVRCRILDDLGTAYKQDGELGLAREKFDTSLELRKEGGSPDELAQSLVNLSRLDVAENDIDEASRRMEEATGILSRTPPTSLHANAEALGAGIRLRQGRAAEGVPYAERALLLNQQFANRSGEAISLATLAQCCREAGQLEAAKTYATACLELNRLIDNDYGVKKAEWLLENLASGGANQD